MESFEKSPLSPTVKERIPQLVLASASPRRADLLEQIGLCFIIKPVGIDEQQLPDENPEAYVCRLAAKKSDQCWQDSTLGLPVLGTDTIVVLGDTVLGKPSNRESGLAILESLSGREHRVLSAVSLRGREHWQTLSETRVWFRKMAASEIRRYWETGEPYDKAGCYGIQGLGSLFVKRIEGSYSGVVGLPIYETAELLSKAGITPLNQQSNIQL